MIDETFLSQTSKVITTSNNDRRNIPQANLKRYNHSNNDRRNIPQSNLKSYNHN